MNNLRKILLIVGVICGFSALDLSAQDNAVDSWYNYPYSKYRYGDKDAASKGQPTDIGRPAVASSSQPNADYSGYYKIGDELVYYDGKTGTYRMMSPGQETTSPPPAVATKPVAPKSDYGSTYKTNPLPNYTPSVRRPSYPPLPATKRDPSKPLISFVSATEKVCQRWTHALSGTEIFPSSSECELDLDGALDSALLTLDVEEERYNQLLAVNANGLSQFIRKSTAVERPTLVKVLGSMSKRGCSCEF